MKDPYIVLGLDKDTPIETLEARYNELKAKYSEDRFLTGAEGNEAARKLSELETAWADIQAEHKKEKNRQEFGSDYSAIDKLIREGKYDEAQSALDAIVSRSAEWHYLQSIIYYKREWLSESRAQLQMAVNAEPWNEKYKSAYEKLNLVMGNPNTNPQSLGADPTQIPQNDNQSCANTCYNCCFAYCLADCCCSMSQCC